MTAEQIDGQDGNKRQQQTIQDNGRRTWINADDQSQAGNQFQKRDNDRNQVDENFRK